MKILVLSNLYPPDFIGGYELCCAQVVAGLAARGHQVQVLTSAPRTPCPPSQGVARRFKLANCYDAYPMMRSHPVTQRLREVEAHFISAHNVHVLTSALEEFQPDVVYVWNLVGLGGMGLIACLDYLRAPWVWYLGDCVPRLLSSRGGRVEPGVAREFSRRIQGYYMPVSQRVVEEIEAGGITLNGPIDITPNWIQGARPAPRERFFAAGGQLRIVSAGQMGRHKGIDLLIEAAALLCQRGYGNFSIELFGRVSDPALSRLVHRRGVEQQVTFRGACPQDELVARYARHEYDLFAFPTWDREPFGCAPLEAAAYGSAMVMSQSCGIGEWFVHGVHCLKVPRTAEAFARVFTDILEGRIDLAPLARRAAAVIWRDFHLDDILDRVEPALNRQAACLPQGAIANAATTRTKAAEAYHLALLAERLAEALVQEVPRQAA